MSVINRTGDNSFHFCDTPWWTCVTTLAYIEDFNFSSWKLERPMLGRTIDLREMDSSRGTDTFLIALFHWPLHNVDFLFICWHQEIFISGVLLFFALYSFVVTTPTFLVMHVSASNITNMLQNLFILFQIILSATSETDSLSCDKKQSLCWSCIHFFCLFVFQNWGRGGSVLISTFLKCFVQLK